MMKITDIARLKSGSSTPPLNPVNVILCTGQSNADDPVLGDTLVYMADAGIENPAYYECCFPGQPFRQWRYCTAWVCRASSVMDSNMKSQLAKLALLIQIISIPSSVWAFFDALPLWAVPPIGLIFLLIYFVFITAVKGAILRNGWQDYFIAKLVFYFFGGRFLMYDALGNVFCFSPLALHWPNQFKEGWLVTSHANAILKNKTRGWSFQVAKAVCRLLDGVDEDHCSNYRRIKSK